jgi:hypothetical protein
MVYLAVARRTVGYKQYTSDITGYAKLAELASTSERTVKRTIPDLIERGYIIKVATNTVTNVGKLAYRYQLNMQLPNFPHLGKLRSSSLEPMSAKLPKTKQSTLLQLPPVTDYIMQGSQILFLSTVDSAKLEILSNRGLIHPTENQLLKHLNKSKTLYTVENFNENLTG